MFAGQVMVGFSTGGGGGGVLGLPPQAAKANVPAKTSTLGKGERGAGRVKLEVRSPKLEAKSVADHADRPSLGFELRTSNFELLTSLLPPLHQHDVRALVDGAHVRIQPGGRGVHHPERLTGFRGPGAQRLPVVEAIR